MSESYDLWHFDGKRPEVLASALPDKGACRRMWRNSSHAAIVRDGLLLEPKPTCDAKKARAIASAAAEAHRTATGAAPVPAFIGPAGGDGKRLLESQSPALRALDARPAPVEPMPAKYVPAPEEPKPARPWATEIADDEVAVTVETPVPADEAPEPVVVVTRKPIPAPETPMPTTTSRCPCGETSAPTADHGGRPSTPEWADLCTVHRNRAMGRRRRTGEGPLSARAWALGEGISDTAPVAKPSKAPASKPSKPAASKPAPIARPSKARTAEAPVSDLLAVIRRQRAVVDALGGIDQAEAIVAAAARVGGPEALVQLVDELAGAVA